MWAQNVMRVAWPAFLSACVLELVVFAMVDPRDLYWFGHPMALSRQSVYSLGFFVFWSISCAAGALTVALGIPATAPEPVLD